MTQLTPASSKMHSSINDLHPPIFILSNQPRSGTNFLYDLICLHPQCSMAPPIWEDSLLYHAELLVEYSNRVQRSWKSFKKIQESHRRQLLRSLGDGLIRFLYHYSQPGLIPVTKTPSTRNIDLFFELFPEARLILLFRDGRAVVDSGMRSFNWRMDEAAWRWARSIRGVVDFLNQASERGIDGQIKVVKYEDLVDNLKPQLKSILEFLGLDPELYDFAAAENAPVRGSSTVREKSDDLHWRPVEKTDDFKPRERWKDWSPALKQRFEWIAGRELRTMGYLESDSQRFSVPSSILHYLRDAAWMSIYAKRRAGRYVKRISGVKKETQERTHKKQPDVTGRTMTTENP